jgi:hypothetical protein
MKLSDRISHLKKREIQAPVVTAIINEFMNELGEDKTLKILAGAIEKDAIKSAGELAEYYKGNSMKELAALIRDVWCQDEAMEIEILKESDSELHFNVTKCKYAEVYRDIVFRPVFSIVAARDSSQ